MDILRELGLKLQNFRKKLAVAIGAKKITQEQFGEMYGDAEAFTPRQITSYETGAVDAPASLLYRLWKGGHSVDGIFKEEGISEKGAESARQLYEEALTVLATRVPPEKRDMVIKEAKNAQDSNPKRSTRGVASTSGRSKARNSAAGQHKKR